MEKSIYGKESGWKINRTLRLHVVGCAMRPWQRDRAGSMICHYIEFSFSRRKKQHHETEARQHFLLTASDRSHYTCGGVFLDGRHAYRIKKASQFLRIRGSWIGNLTQNGWPLQNYSLGSDRGERQIIMSGLLQDRRCVWRRRCLALPLPLLLALLVVRAPTTSYGQKQGKCPKLMDFGLIEEEDWRWRW
jgi:hypothetical protein